MIVALAFVDPQHGLSVGCNNRLALEPAAVVEDTSVARKIRFSADRPERRQRCSTGARRKDGPRIASILAQA